MTRAVAKALLVRTGRAGPRNLRLISCPRHRTERMRRSSFQEELSPLWSWMLMSAASAWTSLPQRILSSTQPASASRGDINTH